MGSKFFHSSKATPGAGLNQEARSISSIAFGGRSAGSRAQKDLGAAMAINKAGNLKPLDRSAAYPKGPKV
jgi:hypothetical protein